jgi:NAD(P)-dependent dehydrogenase (short-subunit alcohol dehydrogenase family)
MGTLDGLTAVVTGGSRGIGAATCVALASEGANVVVNYNDSGDAAVQVAARVSELGSRAHVVRADVASVEACRRMVAEAAEAFGRLDILVNNAGGPFGSMPFTEITEEHYDRVINANLKGTFFCAQAAVPHMRRVGRGKIINLASELLFTGHTFMAAYTAAKGGVVGLTRSLALALGPEITVNTIAPGPTTTERLVNERWFREENEVHLARVPLHRWGTPEEVALAVVFMAGPGADWMTGQTININGGITMP